MNSCPGLTFITAHEFTQPCSILSLNSDTMGAPSAAEASYLYHSTWVHSALFNLVFEQALGAPFVSLFKDKIEQVWVNSCAVIKVRSFCCIRGTHRVTVQRQDWARLLTFITAHEFTQPCSILSLNNDTMGAPSAAETSYLYHRTWVHPAFISCDKGKKFLLH
jgi:hypothetical protein